MNITNSYRIYSRLVIHSNRDSMNTGRYVYVRATRLLFDNKHVPCMFAVFYQHDTFLLGFLVLF